ncbi:MAG: hypothetical protein IJW51_04865 [Clostridia bacterium]|nr:hypothetical protein [Clostridia bacterium]MBQ9802383.1 hypothetical protein [Clostridia bacterium]
MRRKTVIGKAEVRAAMEELLAWRRASECFMARVKDEEEWYRLRVAPRAHKNSEGESFAPTSAWLFNALMQKHADLMENIPMATCLPREESDEEDARALSAILPVILDRSNFEGAYSDNMWYKLKHGVCAWGVFWNSELENGMGDVAVRAVDMGNLFWQPDVRHIQQSRSVYVVEMAEISALRAQFPRFDGRVNGDIDAFFCPQESADGKVAVVDWYYKKRTPSGRTVLHYCKFVGDTVLFATENDPAYAEGWYEHGQYPFVLDVLYPIEGSTLGFGVIAVGRDPQNYIDRMDRNLLEYMDWATRVRYFCKNTTGINENEFCDLSRRIVSVEGDPDEERLRQIEVTPLDDIWLSIKNEKISELKETTANRDVLHGATDRGVTAASAIAALQEAANKTMRDVINASYRAFVELARLMVECVRQFYSEVRCFRILGKNGVHRYLNWSNCNIKEQERGYTGNGLPLTRRPIFDIDVRAEKQNPYTRYSYNEMLTNLYTMGVFDPANARASQVLLDAMDFPGVESLRAQITDFLREEEAAAPQGRGGKQVTSVQVPLSEQAAVCGAALQDDAVGDAAI